MDGNLCRCTGYRPIWDAAKSLCGDAHECAHAMNDDKLDIEDLSRCHMHDKNSGGGAAKKKALTVTTTASRMLSTQPLATSGSGNAAVTEAPYPEHFIKLSTDFSKC